MIFEVHDLHKGKLCVTFYFAFSLHLISSSAVFADELLINLIPNDCKQEK